MLKRLNSWRHVGVVTRKGGMLGIKRHPVDVVVTQRLGETYLLGVCFMY